MESGHKQSGAVSIVRFAIADSFFPARTAVRGSFLRWIYLATLGLVSSAAVADEWMPPSKEIYISSDGTARLTVSPRDLESALAYFRDKVAHREPAGAPAGSTAHSASATLERKAAGQWEKAWTKPLENEVAPVSVVVANQGNGFATLDDWHGLGYGPNAVVIYAPTGALIRRFALNDLFPNWFIDALPHSTSSIHWRGEPRISKDGSELVVPVVQPSTDQTGALDEGTKADLAFRLRDGVPIGLGRPQWKTAMAQAAITANRICFDERAALRKWNAPVSAPTTHNETDWHFYLRETQYRSKWNADDTPEPGTTVLREPTAHDYQASLGWLRDALTEKAVIPDDLRAIGSPNFENLTTEIERIAPQIRQGQLKDVDLVIVADATHGQRIREALSHSGADLTIIDPSRSFPQVRERMQDERQLVVCQAPTNKMANASLWTALPFLALACGIFLLRRTYPH